MSVWDSDINPESFVGMADELLKQLFPICRSITGNGLRQSIKILQQYMPLNVREVESGTAVFDWVVPDEWNIRGAYIENAAGERIIDFAENNLHVVGYSIPVDKWLSLNDLKPFLHTLPDQPDAIPYLTTYYNRTWGFCLSQNQLAAMQEGEYHVVIDSTLEPGAITLAEAVLEGEIEEEVLISSYLCHPSMANNELSGPIISVLLYTYLSKLPKRRHTYRFYFGAETIGALVYLQLRGEHFAEKLKAGLVLTCCGDNGKFNYKKVKREDNFLDKPVVHSLRYSNVKYKIRDFFPSGSDERQYCSPGFNFPVGSIMRSVYGEFPEYHTSLDDLKFVTPQQLLETLFVYVNALYAFDNNQYYLNKKPYGEPFFSQYGLYPTLGGKKDHPQKNSIMKYILSFSDGHHDLIDIADKLDLPIWDLMPVVDQLCHADLLGIENK